MSAKRFHSAIRATTLGFIMAVVTACGPISGQTSGGGGGLAEDGRVYALVPDAAAARKVQRAARELGYSAEPQLRLTGLDLWMVPVDLPATVAGSEAIGSIERAVPDATVGVNHGYRLQVTGTGLGGTTNFSNALIAWPNKVCQAKRRVGLIDGTVNAASRELADVRVRSQSFVDQSNAAGARHGTEVATVLADTTRLRALELYSADVIDTDPTGDPIAGAAEIVQALDWMAQSGVEVVSVSLAGPYNKLLDLAIAAADRKGIVVVAAVGNLGPRAEPQYPAALPSVVAVTAIDAKERIYRSAVRGTHVDLAAAGVDVFVPSGETGRFVSGTSVAVPFVTASLAAQDQVDVDALFEAARDLGAEGKDAVFGHGLLQASDVCGL